MYIVHIGSTILYDELKNKSLNIWDPDFNFVKPNYHIFSLEIEHFA